MAELEHNLLEKAEILYVKYATGRFGIIHCYDKSRKALFLPEGAKLVEKSEFESYKKKKLSEKEKQESAVMKRKQERDDKKLAESMKRISFSEK